MEKDLDLCYLYKNLYGGKVMSDLKPYLFIMIRMKNLKMMNKRI